ncbi:MAG: ATP-dependent DNA helicase [Lachnospiraceae bacterium]
MEKNKYADVTYLLHQAGLLKEKEKIVGFIDCAILLEERMKNGYRYCIVDPITFRTYHLCNRKMQIPKYNYYILEEKARRYGDFLEPMDVLELDLDRRAKLLLEELFVHILPRHGMKYRPQQMELSLTMLQALQNQVIALCEAEVGTGKTHAYLLAITIKNLFEHTPRSAVIATSTIALQKALTEEYLPQISKSLMQERIISHELKYVVRKGKKHYICDRRLESYAKSISTNKEDLELVQYLDMLRRNEHMIDLDFLQFSKYVKNSICVNRCDQRCGLRAYCRYQTFLKSCRTDFYDFQIVNHNYLIADLLVRKQGEKQLLSDFGTIVIDEAHKLPDTIRSMYSVAFSYSEIPNVVKRITTVQQLAFSECERLVEKNVKLFSMLEEIKSSSGSLILDDRITSFIKELQRMVKTLIEHKYLKSLVNHRVGKGIIYDLEKIVHKLIFFTDPDQYVIWIEKKQNRELQLLALSKQLKDQINKDLWGTGVATILTSGTISVKGDFSYLENHAGLQDQTSRMIRITTNSPFDYDRQALLYLPQHIPAPKANNKKYMEAITKEIVALMHATYGHALILFTSYRMMEQVYEEMKTYELTYPIFMMERGRLEVIDSFKRSGNGILFASDSAGEGIDLAGDIVSSLIVVKLPFPIPSAISEHLVHVSGGFEDYLNTDIIPNMLIKLRQWFGRGIRRETDTCVFTILDIRASKRYYKELMLVLPSMPETRSIKDVENFIKKTKDISYFEES